MNNAITLQSHSLLLLMAVGYLIWHAASWYARRKDRHAQSRRAAEIDARVDGDAGRTARMVSERATNRLLHFDRRLNRIDRRMNRQDARLNRMQAAIDSTLRQAQPGHEFARSRDSAPLDLTRRAMAHGGVK